MINLIVSVLGALMVMGGLYFMYLGFNIPPNPVAFFVGLIASVFGVILVIFFGSRIDLSRSAISRPKKEVSPKPSTKKSKPVKVPPKVKKPTIPRSTAKTKAIKPKTKPKEEPKLVKPTKTSPPLKTGKAIKPEKAVKPKEKAITPKKITPQAKPKADTEKPTTIPSDIAKKPKETPKKIK